MEANAGLVAGSHNRNELVVIRQTSDSEGVGHLTLAQALDLLNLDIAAAQDAYRHFSQLELCRIFRYFGLISSWHLEG